MPLFYDEEKKGWSIENMTESEEEQLLALGAMHLGQLIGAAMLKKAHEAQLLEGLEPDEMGQA